MTEQRMNGADALLQTFVANGVTACFANPGTSEMQFVSALDREPAMRSVLCLFEGVATGAADGYGRVAGTSPANTDDLPEGFSRYFTDERVEALLQFQRMTADGDFRITADGHLRVSR